jgi:hypothetical protein
VWSGFVGSSGLGLCYYRRLNEEIQVGVELENSYQQQVTNVSVGYQFDLPKANFTMKGTVDCLLLAMIFTLILILTTSHHVYF